MVIAHSCMLHRAIILVTLVKTALLHSQTNQYKLKSSSKLTLITQEDQFK